MIEQGLFKRHFVGRDGFQWWIGQVAPEDTWKENIPGVPVDNNEDESYKGFGERVRVRIMGYHTESVQDIPDEELPWAHVMYPTTAGGGGRGSWQSMNLVGGNFVFGFFIDGEDAQQPVIMGVIGYNDYQEVMKSLDSGSPRFVPHSSRDDQQGNDTVPPYDVKEGGAGQTAGQTYAQGTPNNDLVIESAQGSNANKEMSAKEMERKGRVQEALAKTEDCEPIPSNRIQIEIQNIMHEMEYLQNSINDVRTAISIGTADIEGEIAGLQKRLARFISSNMKSIFEQTEKKIIEEMNSAVKPLHNLLFPNERPELKEAMEQANELIACLFTKMFEQMFSMCDDFLSDMLGTAESGSGGNDTGAKKAINIPTCFVDDFIGTAVGSVTNELNSQLDGIMSGLDGILQGISVASAAAGGLGSAGSLGSISSMGSIDISSILEDAFSFFGCEEETKCPTQDTWSTWYGMETGQSSSKSSQKSISKSAQKTSSLSEDIGDGFSNISFGGLYTDGQCGNQEDNLGPEECGPPRVKITGGFGADANVIVSQTGKVLAIDVTTLGVNYSDFDANIKVVDNCGNGSGAIIEAQTGIATVTDNGDGTLTISNGSITNTIPGGRTGDGNLGYFDDPEEPLIPILDVEGNPTPDGGNTNTIIDGVVISPGTDYLTRPDGSYGGDGRTWARPEDTIITTPIESGGIGWYPPVPPGVTVPVNPGDVVVTPPTSPVVEPVPFPVPTPTPVEPEVPGGGGPPLPPSTPDRPLFPDVEEPVVGGGGDTVIPDVLPIPPGSPTTIEYPSLITTPPIKRDVVRENYPIGSDSSYPVILYLCDLIIQDSGFNYSVNDELIISPSNGASATVKLDEIGRVVSVTIDSGGEGFTDIPKIYIESQTGYNVKLTPKFCIDRVTDEFQEPAIDDKLVTVVDCTTRSPNGYLNGRPYYGPYHEHNGVKMVGSRHTSLSHAILTDRP